MILESYVQGRWQAGQPEGNSQLVNPTSEEEVATTSTAGIDFGAALAFARDKGGPALREMGFARRAEMIGAMSKAIHEHREELLDLATQNGGNTRGDGKFDIDGATGTLSYYAKVGAALGDTNLWRDGDAQQLTRSPRLVGQHFYMPRNGAAILINAFNFPAWGFAEKAAVALLAGMPVVTKPATSTALVAHRIAQILVESQVLPQGAFTFLCGSAGDLLDHVTWQDVVAFTGSADTGLTIRGHRRVLAQGTRVNVEADSLNAAVLGPDLSSNASAYDLFLQEVVRDMTQKAGQKCTAIRRIMVPRNTLASVRDDLCEQLKAVRTGDPSLREVKVGPVATAGQLRSVREVVEQLKSEAKAVLGDGGRGQLTGIDHNKGYFISPTLLECEDPAGAQAVHRREAFGPVATLMPYDGTAAGAAQLLARGEGSLVSSVYSDDEQFAADVVRAAGPYLGRMHLGSSKVAEHSVGPGTVLPMFNHGGPGRAGGGSELGGLRALSFYMEKTAVQGFAPWLEKLN